MKKIRLFFRSRYRRLIRLAAALSSSLLLVFGVLSVSAAESYYFFFSQPQVTDCSCYWEIVRSDGYCFVVYGVAATKPKDFVATLSNGKIYFQADGVDETEQCFYIMDRWTGGTLITARDNGIYYYDLGSYTVGAIYAHNAYNKGFSAFTWDKVFLYGQDLQVTDKFNEVLAILSQLKSSGATAAQIQQVITSIGNLDSHTNDNLQLILSAITTQTKTQNEKLDAILQAIKDNKSSAEKNEYSGATTEQKKAQSDLDTSEKKISEDTAEARATTINIFKNFSVVGDISKGLLSVTNLFNDLCLRFSPSAGLLNFSLALGIGAFLLGVSAYVVSKVIHRGGK